MKTEIVIIMLILPLTGIFSLTQMNTLMTAPSDIIRVPEQYPTIQEAVNAASPGDAILVSSGMYNENLLIYKDNLTLLGENPETTIIDSLGIGEVVYITASNVYISGFTIRNGYRGVHLHYANNASFVRNIIANNAEYGIYIEYSTNNIFRENKIIYNWQAFFFLYSSGNSIYHNSFNNQIQVQLVESTGNMWDDGYPSGGNYWRDYGGIDEKNGPNQDQSGSDGIGDTPYIIDENNEDRYPLMKPFVSHDIGITTLVFSKAIIKRRTPVQINITVLNFGTNIETFNATLYADKDKTVIGDEVFIGIETACTLDSRKSKVFVFEWNTTNVFYGIYWISAKVSTVEGESDITDNIHVGKFVFVFLGISSSGRLHIFKFLY